MVDFTYKNAPVKLFFGESKITEVAREIKRYGMKALLVFGGSSFIKNGYYQIFTDALAKEGVSHIDLGGNTYPSLAKVRKGIELCRAEKVDCAIGIGGGTCMDVTKAVAFGVLQGEDIWQFLTNELSEAGRPHLPVGTVVTYPSSGSEMNGVAQIDEDDTRQKTGLSSVYPDFAWLNPEYMMSIEKIPLAYGQLTAFVQGSSGYVSLEKAELTETMSAGLLKAILDNLKRSIDAPADKEARRDLMLTTVMGMFDLTFFGKSGDWTLMPLTGLMQNYLDIPYTKALTIIFPYFIKEIYNGDRVFKSYFHNVLDVDIDAKSDNDVLNAGLEKLWEIYRQFGIATTFNELMTAPIDPKELLNILYGMEEMPSQYGAFTPERLKKILLDAIGR
jgi:alcohol dehydrogenase YqhD (iron-dependent ADH family)